MQNNQLQDLQEINLELQQASPLENNSRLHKIKPIFKSHTTWRCVTSSDPSYIIKYQPKLLSHISISKLRSQEIGMGGLRKLRRVLVSCKIISSLRLNEKELNSKQMTFLFYATNHWRKFYFSDNPDHFIATFLRFGRCKNLEFFPFAKKSSGPGMQIIQPVNRNMRIHIRKQLEAQRKMKTLLLSFPFCTIFRFKPPRSLQNLHLAFQNRDRLTKQALKKFASSLQQCSQLERLSLDFSYDYQIVLLDALIWNSCFQKISLKKLVISIFFSLEQEMKELQPFMSSLGHLKSIASLEIKFIGSFYFDFEPDFFSSLSTSLQSMIQLEELALLFAEFPRNNSFKQVISTLRLLKNLKKLRIDLSPLESPDYALLPLSEYLKYLNHLQTLEIRAPNTDFGARSIQILSNNLAHHKLTSLSLISYQPFGRESRLLQAIKSGVKKAFKAFKNSTLFPCFSNLGKLVHLSTLDLPLSNFEISNQDWNSSSVALGQLKKLSSVILDLPKLDSKNNFEGFKNFLSCIQNLPKLKKLSLYFKMEISDEEVGILASYLAGCPNLKDLTLFFDKGSQLGDQSLYFLRSGIKVLLALENLRIHFYKENPFGEEAVIEFFKGLGVLKNLSTFYFHRKTNSMQNIVPLPVNIKDYCNMRQLTVFSVDHSQLI